MYTYISLNLTLRHREQARLGDVEQLVKVIGIASIFFFCLIHLGPPTACPQQLQNFTIHHVTN